MLAAGPLQICVGYSAGAVQMMMVQTEIRLVDASKIQITCPGISMYIINTRISPSRLLTCGGVEILSHEGTTQGDPLAMQWYAINTSILIPGVLIPSLRARIPEVKQVWLVDDSAGGGLMELLYNGCKLFSQEGKKFGYLINGSKSWLIVKPGQYRHKIQQTRPSWCLERRSQL